MESLSEAQQEVVNVLQELDTKLPIHEITTILGKSRTYVQRTVTSLWKKGVLKRDRWRTTEVYGKRYTDYLYYLPSCSEVVGGDEEG